MNNVFFVADTHFGHSAILKYCTRPFSTADEMDETLIANWNKVVKPTDVIYHLGDFSYHTPEKMREIFRRLNGNIHLVRGNHDHYRGISTFLSMGFIDVCEMKTIKVGGQEITLCHYPLVTWNASHYGETWNLHGHHHGTLKVKIENTDPNSYKDMSNKRIDVGVDCWNFTPVSFEQIEQKMKEL